MSHNRGAPPERLERLRFRLATAQDASALAAVAVEGFETYRAFAPPEWAPPTAQVMAALLGERLGQSDAWAMVAEDGSALAGHVALGPAAAGYRPVADRELAHLWQLFARPAWWGTGLAVRLHAEAVDAARARGFAAMRLFTPAGQARARRFYEREGWALTGPPEFDDGFGLDVAEYRIGLAPGSAPPQPASQRASWRA